MKPNLVLIQPAHAEAAPVIDRFCEMMCGTHYVYLIRPINGFQEDSPAGVRYLNFSIDRLPGFGEVESVIVVGGQDIAATVKEKYPAARLSHWPIETERDFPAAFDPTIPDTIIQGRFRRIASPELAKAM